MKLGGFSGALCSKRGRNAGKADDEAREESSRLPQRVESHSYYLGLHSDYLQFEWPHAFDGQRGWKGFRQITMCRGMVDVEANFLVVKAYQYTSITSVMLLDCWSIRCVMLLTWLFLKKKYRCGKITGVVVCVPGLVMVVFSDVHAGDRSDKEYMLGQMREEPPYRRCINNCWCYTLCH